MILLWFLLLPFLGGLVSLSLEKINRKYSRFSALFTMIILLVFSIYFYFLNFNTNNIVIVKYRTLWIERFGISLNLAVDGISLSMVLLTVFLGLLSILCSFKEINKCIGLFYFNLFWILGSVIGVFLAMDLFLFLFFWEIMIFPMYFIMYIWGNAYKEKIAIKFFIYSQLSGLVLIITILTLVVSNFYVTGNFIFDFQQLVNTQIEDKLGFILMLGFFISFAIKLPVVPLHNWLPDVMAKNPKYGSLDLIGILIKTAAYGLLRFNLCLFPKQSLLFAPYAMILGIISIYYGAILAFSQINIKRLMAYSSISHMGYVLLAIFSSNILSLQGAIIFVISNTLTSAGLIIISGLLYERLNTFDIRFMGGLFGKIGAIPGFALVLTLALLGLPGTGNFIGEFLILLGNFKFFPKLTIFSSLGLILTAIYSLNLIHKVYYGKRKRKRKRKINIFLSISEVNILSIILFIIFIIGLYPQIFFDISIKSITKIAQKTMFFY
ncbi:NADH-quinone oxidoreductase subunit M [Candidatus Portiera aleyrodidarum]|uniref:NADH-quinone oxidoreductase subunit M n=1 Tax=Candidatus Portiera aleyrodidarum TaxID=91844 RepID=A0A6S6RRU9_9GAMM|nr:NADH-quinone oxidoreductase subunit M [Candidatus Portiera aleyrodidarum]CAA3704412.1 NADH-quinone oxidoreductase subunit M [Candidatus Portiera aleyrodidarum]